MLATAGVVLIVALVVLGAASFVYICILAQGMSR